MPQRPSPESDVGVRVGAEVEQVVVAGEIRRAAVDGDKDGETGIDFQDIVPDGHSLGYVLKSDRLADRLVNRVVDDHAAGAERALDKDALVGVGVDDVIRDQPLESREGVAADSHGVRVNLVAQHLGGTVAQDPHAVVVGEVVLTRLGDAVGRVGLKADGVVEDHIVRGHAR